jgi:plasmid stabilization system protein ParE
MTRVLVSWPAKRDIRDILTDLNRHAGHLVASRYAAEFKNVYRNLAQFPDSGSSRPALGPLARIKLVHPYVIVYDRDVNVVTVLRVLHGRRDITVKLISR